MGEARTATFRSHVFNGEIYSFRLTLLVVCVTIASSYLAPTLVGMLVSNPKTVWPLWPGCAILVTGLLLVPVNVWLVVIAASFIGFAVADLQAGVPLSSIVRFIPGNTVEVLVSAIGLRYCFAGVPRLTSVKSLVKYWVFAIVLAPSAGAFFSATGVARDYWTGWKIVFLSEVLAFLTVSPALLGWISEGRVFMRRSRAHHIEGGILIAGLVLVSYIVFTLPEDSRTPALFYMLVPFLLWSALRFGWLGVSTSLSVVTALSIWGTVYGRGPFSHLVPLSNPIPLQLFLVFVSIPFMILSALAEEREQAAHVVRESESRFRLLADMAPVLIWQSGLDKLCTYFNKPWLDFTGRSLEQELGNGWADGVHPDDFQRCLDTYTQSFDRSESFEMEYRLQRHDGEYRWIFDTGVPRYTQEGVFAGYIGSCVDVTERKRAEESRFRHAAIVESSTDAIISKNLEGVITSWNAGAEHMFGYTEAEAVGQPITMIIPPEFWKEENELLQRLRAGGRIEHYETTRVSKTGRKVDVSLIISPIKDSNGQLVGFCKLARDISDRKRHEEKLREYERAVENAEDMIGVVDREYRFLLANRQYLKMRNLTRDQVVGHLIPEVLGKETFETVIKSKLDECFNGNMVRYQRKFLYPGIGERHLLLSYHPIESADGRIDRAACILHDITELKRAEEALSDMSRKLIESQEQERARIGRELHDDINQRLAMLALDLEQLQDNPSDVRSRVQELRRQTTELSNDVQALSHDLHSSKLEYLGVIAGMKSWCKEFGERQRMEIDFTNEVSSTLPFEVGLSLFRVIQEAFHNAVKHSGVKRIEVQLSEMSGEIQLIVSDAGRGFDLGTAMHGRGLGLTSMKERVRLVDGTISIESKPRGGTTIRIRVPLESKHVADREKA